MKLKVVRGIQSPFDHAQKNDRRAVVLAADGKAGIIVLAPATTYFQRTQRVPPGHVLLLKGGLCYESSGFDADAILISIRDAFRVSINSTWVKRMVEIGELDTEKDKRFECQFKQLLREYYNCLMTGRVVE